MERYADRLGVRVPLARHGLEGLLGVVEGVFVGVEPFQPVFVFLQHAEGLDIGIAGLGIDALDGELLVDHRLDVERDGLVLRLDSAQDDRPADAGRGDGVLDRRCCARDHVERDVDAPPAGDRHDAFDDVFSRSASIVWSAPRASARRSL